MDDLPTKVQHLPQVHNRFVEWCFFEAYNFDETAKLLSRLHPHFAHLDLKTVAHREQVEFVYETFGGFPGLIVPFLKKLTHQQGRETEEITLIYLRTIHMRTFMDKEQATNKSLEIYRGRPPKDSKREFVRNEERRKASEQSNANNTKGKKRVGRPRKPPATVVKAEASPVTEHPDTTIN